jgi:hypothetical protein
MNRITATMKELVAEVIGDGNMFDKARQEKAMAAGSKGDGLNTRSALYFLEVEFKFR